MLQGEVSETQRIHIWNPELRTIPLEGYRDIHDHRFDLISHVLIGELIDIRYQVTPKFLGEGDTDAWEIKHAKIQVDDRPVHGKGVWQVDTGAPASSPNTKWIGRAKVLEAYRTKYSVGDSYSIVRREWHTTKTSCPLALTFVERSNFDDRPARILGAGISAIISYADDNPARESHATLIRKLIDQAQNSFMALLGTFKQA